MAAHPTPPHENPASGGDGLAALRDENARLRAEVEQLRIENQLLRQRIDIIIRQLYDKKSEALDPAQLQLQLDPDSAKKAAAADSADPGPAAEPAPAKKRSPRKPRDISHLEIRETVVIDDEVKADPESFREIERITTDRYDYQAAVIFISRLTRAVHVRIGDPDAVPVKAPAPPSLGLGANPRLVAYVLASKYCHHRPHYRTQTIIGQRHGVEFARNTFCHWDRTVADICEPLYKLIHSSLLQSGNLQADETPIRYLDPGRGKCATGYLWVIHAPRNGIKGDILYQWHPSRKAACLDDLLGDYQGFLQTDAYAGYDSWSSNRSGVVLFSCWAHARRKFHEAFKTGQALAAGPLAAIQRIYQVEDTLRKARALPAERMRLRQEQAAPVLQTLKIDLVALRQNPGVLPQSPLGKAIDYTLRLWDRLTLYLGNGELEIDNNWIENGIRPSAVGKKSWLFVGGETTGQRAAIIYTLVECARRYGHNPELYLTDILGRLPAMTNQDDLGALLPSRWQPTTAAGATVEVAATPVATMAAI
jgi:transposase